MMLKDTVFDVRVWVAVYKEKLILNDTVFE
jgi:hypothetical protein